MILIEPAQSLSSSDPKPRRWPLSQRELTRFLADAQQLIGLEGRVYVLLTDDDTVRQLNKQYRRKSKPTDILSFPALQHTYHGKVPIVGDLAVSLETASRQAQGLDHTLQTEVKILLLHGLLHLAGMDHERDTGQMARRESRLRKQLELPSGLIQRSAAPAKKAAPARATKAKSSARKVKPATARKPRQ